MTSYAPHYGPPLSMRLRRLLVIQQHGVDCHSMGGPGGPGGAGRRHRHGTPHEMPGFLGRGPRAGRGDIRAAILALLAEQPMHGYQIMRELTERTGGVWRPSPGSIYPTLQLLQDEGLVRSEDAEGGRKLFHLTDEGTVNVGNSDARPPWEAVAAERDTGAVDLRDLVGGVMAAARQVVHDGTTEQRTQAAEVLRDARRRLYRVLADEPTEDTEPTP